MFFDKNAYRDEKAGLGRGKLLCRAYRDILFVDRPSDDTFQRMNLFVPLAFYDGRRINGYTLKTAPIFMPNAVGGYLPCKAESPAESRTIRHALSRGYVVASPALRGRTLKDADGKNYGKAPAGLIDYKAAIRFLRYFADELPGDCEKIITNGTSAGGALSCLAGTTGNHPDYEDYLREIGAADAKDHVYASSCYCPITDLDHADMAYEWQFDGVYRYQRLQMRLDEGGRPFFSPVSGTMTGEQIRLSQEESARFPAYLNSLALKDDNGNPLTLDENGNGSFKEYVKSIILASAQKEIDGGARIKGKKWLTIENGKAADMDFSLYAAHITRMKTAPAFDDVTMDSAENHLFGDAEHDFAHFTAFSKAHSKTGGAIADPSRVKMLNPLYYIDDERAQKARFFRLRHGEHDRDTSLAVSAILNLKLKEIGCNVDYAAPWTAPHAGDYDLDDLFDWIDAIVKRGG